MPYKTFAVNEILTAADVNEYLMDQAVMSFAGTAARGSAIASPSEGMVSYLDDSNQLEVFDGSNWVGLAGASVGTATPASTAEGDFWLDTDSSDGQVLKAYNSGWKNVGPVSHNAVINGDFGVWQRGTSFTGVTGSPFYSADRFRHILSGATVSVTRESFTPAEIETIGYGDAEYYLKLDVTVADDFSSTAQFIEDVRTFAGQTVTFSFWAKSDSARTLRAVFVQSFGSGGSGTVAITENISVTTSWQRFTVTKTLGSMSGKTIGAGSFLEVRIDNATNETWELSTWGWQLEAGSVATPFRLAGGGSKAAELALCQRYYYVHVPESAGAKPIGVGYYYSATQIETVINFPVSMRTGPSLDIASGTDYYLQLANGVSDGFDDYSITQTTSSTCLLFNNTDVSGTGGQAGRAQTNNTSASIAFDAEL